MKFSIVIAFTVLVSVAYGMSVKQYKSRAVATKSEGKYEFLEFLELKQFPAKDHKDKYDLSGLVADSKGTVYAISDKEKNNFVYSVDWKKAKLNPTISFGITDKIDIEAIDVCGEDFYLSNEKNNKFYIVRSGQPTKRIDIDFSQVGIKSQLFSGNQGFEGMAVDCENQILYAAKQHSPRFIVNIDLKTNKILKKWTIPETDAFDFADAKFEKGFLYVIERMGLVVTKIDIKTEKVVAKYSYQNMEKSAGYLYGPAVYTFAEALLLTKDEIWIGFDNNGLKTTQQSQEELGLSGRDPLIMRFKRPDNF